ncbi:iron complex transport system substrate-binding protein [Kitasatospora sp. MAA19]|uniref:ABC transporter substrate-binding protein n=1 Tax=unclassified Kitasatospora TaxID=2633591 RepID=UPI002475E4E6|nr:ABC transporter substrate-binding protein [Kitasatospora sp. MAA19]MDH6705080.1 iron complex transport system substrate-binding protein [Kitasatospora sp. MAA19]
MRTKAVAATALLALGLTACGAEIAPSADSTAASAHYPVTVENCGTKLTFPQKPARTVTNDVGITELMLALGLADRMAGYVMPDDKGKVDQVAWKDGYRQTGWLSRKQITKEIVLGAKADLVFAGWHYGFDEGSGFTPQALKDLGIASYVLSESCRSGKGTERGVMSPLDALYTDLANLGEVFDVRDRADKLIADFKAQVAAVPQPGRRPSVFLYDSGQDKPYTAGRFAAADEIITKAGGTNVMGDLADSWVTTGWESVVQRDPEVIVINDYGETGAEAKRNFLTSFPPLAGVSAIRNDRIFVLDYVDLVESPRNPAAISALAAYLGTVPAR